MNTIFTVKGENINIFTPDMFVEFYQEMLWADARRIKLPVTKINISTKTNVPDGGIDASVEDASLATGDLIVDKNVFYQIKAGENFSPWQESEIKKELFNNKEIKKEHLASYVKECFEKNGTYVVVCPKIPLTPKQRSDAETHIKGMIAKCSFSDPKVQVWGQDKIIGTLQGFPSLSLRITGRDRTHFQSHSSWSEDEEMRKPFELEEKQKEFIETLRKNLRDDAEAVHVSVYGETGIGKTRLVLEATKEKDIKPLVIYCDSPLKFRNSDLENVILSDNDLHAILIIDECDKENRSRIWDTLKNKGARIKLITIYNESERLSGTTKMIEAPNLSNEGISKIIQQYHNDKFQADKVATLCNGVPRYAHALGLDLKNNPGEFFRTPDTNNMWDRSIRAGDNPESQEVKQRKRVLLVLSLFKKFGHGSNFQDEMKAIHSIIQKMDTSITLATYQEIIKLLQRRKILQGVDTLYISPKALHLKLWIEFWDTYGAIFDFESIKQFSPKLLEWFFEMFEYAEKSEGASKIVKDLFSLFKSVKDVQSRLGARLFMTLAKSDPRSATDYLKNTVGKMSPEDLRNFTEGRREVIYALERIVWEKELFDDGARLLLALAEAENEAWANNATGIFTSLFSHAPGKVAMTKIPPKDRLKILKETLCDKSKERRKIGLKACGAALHAHHFIRASGIDMNELRLDDEGWTPQTVDELIESYKNVIDMLAEKLKELPEDEQKEVVDLIFGNARGLLSSLPKISSFVVDKLETLGKSENVNMENILRDVIDILEFDGKDLALDIKQRLEKLEEVFTGKDFSSLMKRYVGMDMMVDLARETREKAREDKIKELAKESLNIQKLKPELKWLVTMEAKYGFMFGYELGKLDEKMNLLPTLLEAQKNAGEKGSGFFLSGYYRAIYERDEKKWEQEIESLAKQENLLRYFMEISWRSGITDKIGLLILELATAGKIKPLEFAHFRYASVVNRLSEDIFKKWIGFLAGFKEKELVFLALDLFYSYFVHRKSKPLDKDMTIGLLTHDAVLKSASRSYVMDGYHWVETAKAFVKQFPKDGLQLVEVILSHLDRGTFFDAEHRQIEPILNEIAYQNPLEVWQIATKYIGPPLDSRAYLVLNWIRGGMFETQSSFVEYVPLDEIWKWIDVNKEKRAPYLARFSPPVLKKERCLAREIVARYGEMESVQRELLANFSTGFISGPASEHYKNKKEMILEFKKSEDNENVKKWLDLYIKSLDFDIDHSRKFEEREF